jgi:hypothetical protein
LLRLGLRLTTLAFLAAGAGIAQDVVSAKAGLAYSVIGRVSIGGERLASGPENRQLNKGDVLSSQAGRAEVLLNPGAVLRIGDKTRIRMDSVELTDARVSLDAGSGVVTVNRLPKLDRVEIHVGGAVVAINVDGVYRFDATSPPRLRVFRGRASLENDALKTGANRGQAVRLLDLHAGRFDLKHADALQQWAEARSAPPPWVPLPPMKCYSTPTHIAEIKDYMRDCLHL